MRHHLLRTAITLGAAGAVAVTVFAGTPEQLPDIALGSTVLLHLERVVAMLGSYAFVLVMVTRGWGGELPAELSTQGLKYPATNGTPSEALQQLVAVSSEIRAEVTELRRRVNILEDDA
jgi:hypothetical protein